MEDNKRMYDAARIRSMTTPNPLPTFAEVVANVIEANKEYRMVKREDIVSEVASALGFPVDKSIAGAVSIELARLAKKNIVAKAKQHGYWVIPR